jgi:site-specific recombinase XerD
VQRKKLEVIGIVKPGTFKVEKSYAERTIEFFTAKIRNPNTRKAYARAAGEFAAWCAEHGIVTLGQVRRPVPIAAYVEGLQHEIAAPSVKLRLAAIRMLFDWLVVGQVMLVNPASSVRGPKYVVKKGKTPVLSVDEARACSM